MKLMYEDGYKTWGEWAVEDEREVSLEEIKRLMNENVFVFIKAVDVENQIIHFGDYDIGY